ncbi:uncharacterized protein BDV14DRAFT_204839 [Aspergillus stella-maris]|uniref:uncharacterized protein n=1 Tax=Aspergillus stella-maris TaxID=1810926 RepID=UPI003CCD8C51
MAQTRPYSKSRRPPVMWDHRKDKYMLLAIFSQLNIRGPDFKQLADMLGSEIYSADMLKRRFRELRQMAAEVIEDRQDRQVEIPHQQSATAKNDVIVIDDPITEEFVARASAASPKTPSPRPAQPPGAQLSPPISNPSSPSIRSSKRRAQTAPPASTTSEKSRKSDDGGPHLSAPKSKSKSRRHDNNDTESSTTGKSKTVLNETGNSRVKKKRRGPKHNAQETQADVTNNTLPEEHTLSSRPATARRPSKNKVNDNSGNSSTSPPSTSVRTQDFQVLTPPITTWDKEWPFGPPPTSPSPKRGRAYGGFYPGRKRFVFPSVYESFP